MGKLDIFRVFASIIASSSFRFDGFDVCDVPVGL